jgi:hypothetical protein
VRIHWRSHWFAWTTFEASGSAVKIIGEVGAASQPPVKVVHRYQVNITDAEYKKLIGMLRYAGVSYGLKQLVGIGLQRIFNLTKNPFHDHKYSMVCSELVAYFFMEVLGEKLTWDSDSVGPRKIKEWLDTRPDLATKIK